MTTKVRKAPAKPRKTASLKAEADAPDPQRRNQGIWIAPSRTAGVRVDESTAMTLGAFYACVRVIAESLAGLPWCPAERRSDGGLDKMPYSDEAWILDVQANPETPAFQWRETMVSHALTWGNGYSEIEFTTYSKKPVWLWQITPDRVDVVRFQGRIIYDISNFSGPNTVLEQDEIYHLRGLGFDGLVGYNIVRLFARLIGKGIALEDAVGGFFGNDSTPGGVLEHPGKLSKEARDNLQQTWERRHAGAANRRKMAVLEEGMKWVSIGLPPEDAQLVQQLGLTPSDMCRIFRVPPHKIADLSRSTNNNIEHQGIEFVKDTLRPWAERLEGEADIKLFGRTNRGRIVTVIDMGELIRGDTAAQTSFLRETFDRGMVSVDDGRTYLGMNPIGPAAGGSKRFVMLNMQLLENAGEVPPPGKGGPVVTTEPSSPAPDPEAEPANMSRIESACLPILQDACRRMLKRECDSDKLEGPALQQWLGKHRGYCREVLLAPAVLLAECYGGSPIAAETSVSLFLDKHLQAERGTDHLACAENIRQYVLAASAARGAA